MKKRYFLTVISVLSASIFFACSNPAEIVEEKIIESESETGEETDLDSEVNDLKNALDQLVKENAETAFVVPEKKENSDPEADDRVENLETFFNEPGNEGLLEKFIEFPEGYEEILDDVKVSVKGNRMTYEYYLKDDYGDMQDSVQENAENTKKLIFNSIRRIIDTKDLLEVEYKYFNKDGSTAARVIISEDENTRDMTFAEYLGTNTVQYYYEHAYGPGYWADSRGELLEKNKDTFSDIRIECEGNNVSYIFVFAEDMGDVQANLDVNMNEEERNSIIQKIKEPTGVTDKVFVSYIYYNPDGSLAGRVDFNG